MGGRCYHKSIYYASVEYSLTELVRSGRAFVMNTYSIACFVLCP